VNGSLVHALGFGWKPFLSLVLALAGAFLLATGASLQWLGHERNGRCDTSGWRVLFVPLWWAGILASAAGTICYYSALWIGLVALVLPVSGLHIALTALAMSRLRKEALLGLRAWGISLVALGVLLCLFGEAGRTAADLPTRHGWMVPGFLGAAGFLSILLLRRTSDRFAVGSGLAFAASAVAWKLMAENPILSDRIVAAAIFAASYTAGFLLIQAGFRRGGAGAVNATANGVATALAMVAAVSLFGEPVPAISWLGTAAVAAGVALIGWRR
jgi:drug/metabolite transporter (DMT)-like permease